jgi:hypothetical protein
LGCGDGWVMAVRSGWAFGREGMGQLVRALGGRGGGCWTPPGIPPSLPQCEDQQRRRAALRCAVLGWAVHGMQLGMPAPPALQALGMPAPPGSAAAGHLWCCSSHCRVLCCSQQQLRSSQQQLRTCCGLPWFVSSWGSLSPPGPAPLANTDPIPSRPDAGNVSRPVRRWRGGDGARVQGNTGGRERGRRRSPSIVDDASN